MTKQRQYKFKGKFLILIGSKKEGGALATVRNFENGRFSYAHLFSDGKILRNGEEIGNVEDLKFVKWVGAEPKILTGMLNMLGRLLND